MWIALLKDEKCHTVIRIKDGSRCVHQHTTQMHMYCEFQQFIFMKGNESFVLVNVSLYVHD